MFSVVADGLASHSGLTYQCQLPDRDWLQAFADIRPTSPGKGSIVQSRLGASHAQVLGCWIHSIGGKGIRGLLMPVSSLPTMVGYWHIIRQFSAVTSPRGKGLEQAFYFIKDFQLDLWKK